MTIFAEGVFRQLCRFAGGDEGCVVGRQRRELGFARGAVHSDAVRLAFQIGEEFAHFLVGNALVRDV